MKNRWIVLLGSGLLYGISLFFPAFALKEGQSSFLPGFVCLLFGFGEFAWYANPLYFASLITLLLKKTYLTALLSCSALAIAVTTIWIEQLPRDASGETTTVVGYGPAFYLWLSSMLVILGASVMDILKAGTSNKCMEGND